jgi:hypothetical protein
MSGASPRGSGLGPYDCRGSAFLLPFKFFCLRADNPANGRKRQTRGEAGRKATGLPTGEVARLLNSGGAQIGSPSEIRSDRGGCRSMNYSDRNRSDSPRSEGDSRSLAWLIPLAAFVLAIAAAFPSKNSMKTLKKLSEHRTPLASSRRLGTTSSSANSTP